MWEFQKDFKVYFGYDFEKNKKDQRNYLTTIEAHIHPKIDWLYHDNRTFNLFKYDLGLLKLNQSIDKSYNKFVANSICLPQKAIKSSVAKKGHYEYVMFSGWGGPTNLLKMAYWRMFSGWQKDKPGSPDEAILYNLDNQTACQVTQFAIT